MVASLSIYIFLLIINLTPPFVCGSLGVFNSRIKFTNTHTHTEKREREREKPVYDLEGVSFSLSLMRVISLRRVSGVIDFNFDCKEKRAAGDFFFFFFKE